MRNYAITLDVIPELRHIPVTQCQRVYHVTRPSKVPSILEHGVRPGHPDRAHWQSSREHVYFWTSLTAARLWAAFMQTGGGGEQTIIECVAPPKGACLRDRHHEVQVNGYKTTRTLQPVREVA